MRDLPTQSIAEKGNYYPFIDGLRGIAILAILLVHTSQIVGNEHPGSLASRTLEDFVNSGARGVQLFFMLSAFSLLISSVARYRTDRYPKVDFYVRRAFRILPFWCLMVIYWAFKTGVIGDVPRILTNASFAFGFIRFRPDVELVPAGWALFCLVTFYLLFPLIFKYIKDVYIALTFLIMTIALSVVWEQLAPKFGVPDGNAFIFLFPLSQWFCFALGVVVYYLTTSGTFKALVLDNRRCFLILDAAAFIAMFLLLRGDYLLATFSLFLLIIASIPSTTIFGLIARNRLLMRFGAYCYSIYVFQFALLYALDPVKEVIFSKMGIANSIVEVKLLVWFPIVALISLVLAFFTFNLIERPCVSLGKKLIPKMNTALDSIARANIISR